MSALVWILLAVFFVILIIVLGVGVVVLIRCLSKKNKTSGYKQFGDDTKSMEIAIKQMTMEEMYTAIRELYMKPIGNTSVGIDIPRLSSKSIIIENGSSLFNGIQVSENYKASEAYKDYFCEMTMKDFLNILIKLLNGEEERERFEAKFNQVFTYINDKDNGDVCYFFKKLVPLLFDENFEGSLTSFVLKTMTQGLFSRPVEYLLPFRMTHPFKDDSEVGWSIEIDVSSPDYIKVKHIKGEKSKQVDAFTFKWNFIYTINRKTNEISSLEINIYDCKFGNYEEAKQRSFNDFVQRIMSNPTFPSN